MEMYDMSTLGKHELAWLEWWGRIEVSGLEAHDSEPIIPSLRTKVMKRKKKHNSWADVSVGGKGLNQADREVKGQWASSAVELDGPELAVFY